MLYQLLDTFRVFPYSMLWFTFQIEPNVNIKRSMFLVIAGFIALLQCLGYSFITSFILVCSVAEVAVRIFIRTVILP